MANQEMIDKWPREKAIKIREIVRRMNLCTCGTTAHWEIILNLLERAENHAKNGSFYNFQLGDDSTDPRDSWVEFGGKVLDSWNLTEHGSGIGWAWLTGDGVLLLKFLRDFGMEDACYPRQEGMQPHWAAEFSWTVEADPKDTYSEWAESVAEPPKSEE